jgi:putative flippase GtrA
MLKTAPEPTRPARSSAPRSFRLIFTRYSIGSVVAAVASEAVLLVTYGSGLLGPSAASIAGWAAGAGVNYSLNRRWVWGRRGAARLWREVLPYWLIALISMIVSAWATDLADDVGSRWFASHGPRVVFVGGAFLMVYGLLFIGKFLIFHYFLFGDRRDRDSDRRPRSRDQVPMTTRR